jgi:hypothetical protein
VYTLIHELGGKNGKGEKGGWWKKVGKENDLTKPIERKLEA